MLLLPLLLACATRTPPPPAVAPAPPAVAPASSPELLSPLPGGLNLRGPEPVQGDPAAGVQVVEFHDLQCPHCAQMILAASDRSGAVIRFKHYPLNNACNPAVAGDHHPWACDAAVMAACLEDKPELFFAFVEEVAENQQSIQGTAELEYILGQVTDGLGAVQACVGSGEGLARVQADAEEGARIGITGVPSRYVSDGSGWFRVAPGVSVPEAIEALPSRRSALSSPVQGSPAPGSPIPSDVIGGVGGLIGSQGESYGSGARPDRVGVVQVVGAPVIEGALDEAAVDAVVQRQMNQLRYCYQRVLTSEPALMGDVVTRFVVTPDGSVSSASTQSITMNNAKVEDCLTGRFVRYVFPEPGDGQSVTVTYHFQFWP